MDHGEKKAARRAETAHQAKKSIEEVLKRVARPAWRSALFFWLVEHHDALRQNEAETGRGVPWRELCVDQTARNRGDAWRLSAWVCAGAFEAVDRCWVEPAGLGNRLAEAS